ncbi:DUF1513 domain-containing protein [Microbaculum marinum]|uniref:DUF1513 domain-containing protein n=1 Tax=Microbaculum marinum TaxID=1764581 RepID=A0AAW9RBR5_9HYPH
MLLAAAGVAPKALAAAPEPDLVRYLTARKRDARFEVAVLDEAGRDLLVVPLEARGHSFAIAGDGRRAIAFARQPGRFAVAFDTTGAEAPTAFASQPDRHFFGHGAFADGDRLLFATENDYDGARGVAGVYDVAAGMRRIGEFATGGLDPHEAVLMPDGRTLCIANGGVLTHPDYGKLELNLDTMAPSLSYVDVTTGDIVEQVSVDPSLHQLAFHHLAVDAYGAVWFGGQYHGPRGDRPPVVGRHRRGREPELFSGSDDVLRDLGNYIGSVAVDSSGTTVATSSPVGGNVAYWDAATGRCLGTTALRDVCGVAAGSAEPFRLTSGYGEMQESGPGMPTDVLIDAPDEPTAWDNHLRRLPTEPASG